MTTYDIITDSSANLPDRLIEAWNLSIMSLEFIVDGVSYKGYNPDAPTDNQQFYDMMRKGLEVKTSLVNLAEAERILRASFDAGRDVLYLGFDSGISGTYLAVSEHMERIWQEFYPERKLRHVDTLAAALGEGLLVAEAVKRRDAGMSLDELADWAVRERLTFAHWFTVDDLKYLQRGGRVSKGAAFAGTLLNVKPVLHVDDQGFLVPVSKVRGRKRSIQSLYEHLEASIRRPTAGQLVYISAADCTDDAEFLKQMILATFPDVEVMINDLDPVIGAHSGPGTLALFFITDGER